MYMMYFTSIHKYIYIYTYILYAIYHPNPILGSAALWTNITRVSLAFELRERERGKSRHDQHERFKVRRNDDDDRQQRATLCIQSPPND